MQDLDDRQIEAVHQAVKSLDSRFDRLEREIITMRLETANLRADFQKEMHSLQLKFQADLNDLNLKFTEFKRKFMTALAVSTFFITAFAAFLRFFPFK
jgi:hypothetical protein